jgi:hypothetical protein
MKACWLLSVLVRVSCVHPVRQAAIPAEVAGHAAPVGESDGGTETYGRKSQERRRLPGRMAGLRLGYGDASERYIEQVIRHSHPNFFNGSGAVFQIDANLGGMAAVPEMLLQSHTG